MHGMSWEAIASILICVDFCYNHAKHFKAIFSFIAVFVMNLVNMGVEID